VAERTHSCPQPGLVDRSDLIPQDATRLAVDLDACFAWVERRHIARDGHHHDARAAGESEQRVASVAVWPESPFFTARERAAFAFTESVTLVAQTHVPAGDYDAVAEHFSPDEIGALLSLIVTINAWNALSVASRAWEPELREA